MIPIPIVALTAVVILGILFMIRCLVAFQEEKSSKRPAPKPNVRDVPFTPPELRIHFAPETIRHNPHTHLAYKTASAGARFSRGM